MMEVLYKVEVSVRTEYLENQSLPSEGKYFFSYTVTIKNVGKIPAKLISRHWVITDANERIEEVRGLGVVGEQPRLKTNESFEYTSGTIINTPSLWKKINITLGIIMILIAFNLIYVYLVK